MKKTFAAIAIVALLLETNCSSIRRIPLEKSEPDERLLAVKYHSGKVVEFKKVVEPDTTAQDPSPDERKRTSKSMTTTRYGLYSAQRGTIDGLGVDGHPVSVPADSVALVTVRRTDVPVTVLAVLGISAGTLLAVVLIAIAAD